MGKEYREGDKKEGRRRSASASLRARSYPLSFHPSPEKEDDETYMLVDEKNSNVWSFCELLEGSFDD